MQIDGLRIGRAGAVALAAACLMELVAPAAHALDGTARLRLEMGDASTGAQPGQWVLEKKQVDASGGVTWDHLITQAIAIQRKCEYSPQAGSLAILQGKVGTTVSPVGVGPDSIGVYDGPKGVGCYRISKTSDESLTVRLGDAVRAAGYGAFLELLLDMEVKDNAIFQLEVLIGTTTVDTFYLTSGSNRDVTTNPITGNPIPGDNVTRCDLGSDSGPDSGGNDNCPWPVAAIGDGFRLTALTGEGSLEGGGDFGAGATEKTVLYLIDGVAGVFGCDATNNATPEVGSGGLSCQIVRQDDSSINTGQNGETCRVVSYLLRAGTNSAGANSCELISDPGEQLVANLFVKYEPEAAPTSLLPQNGWQSQPLSFVRFGNDPDQTPHKIPGCLGVSVIGSDRTQEVDGVVTRLGPVRIPEFAGKAENPDYDRVFGNSTVEYACAFERTETYDCVPNPATPGAGCPSGNRKVIIEEGIQFWGDISFARQ